MKAVYRLLLALVIALAVDGVTKAWAEQALILDHPLPLIRQFFRLTLGYNTGVAFGLFANGGIWPLVITGLIIIGLAVWLVNTLRSGELLYTAAWPIGLILGGAIANFADRLPDGRVTDFLDVGVGMARWPTFNLADSFIVLGLILLLVAARFEKRSPEST